METARKFSDKLKDILDKKGVNSVYLTKSKYIELVSRVKAAKAKTRRKIPQEYKLLKRYDVIQVGHLEKLIYPVIGDGATIKQKKARVGLKTTSLPTNVISKIKTEEELAEIINDINPRSTLTESNAEETDDQVPIIGNQEEEMVKNAVKVKKDESQTRNKTDIPSQDVLAIEAEENPADNIPIEAEENPADNIRNRQHLIRDKRKMVVTNLEIQANRMKSVSLANHPIGKIGETVRIPIPDVDRARGDLRNILGVILAVEDNNYSIGTKLGKLQQMYSGNQFTICKQSMVAIDDVPESVEVSLRECARKSSCVGG
ncbi:hypothetical protein QE152_g4944 [Popillia japonica]|uniref:Uncharacterized protein n=1 Tax=Popillia japonica TaxID=7064 RepID=A0AAW1MR10_POPJA